MNIRESRVQQIQYTSLKLNYDFQRCVGLLNRAAMRRKGQCFLRSDKTPSLILNQSGRIIENNNKGCLDFGLQRASTIGVPFSTIWKGEGQAKIFS